MPGPNLGLLLLEQQCGFLFLLNNDQDYLYETQQCGALRNSHKQPPLKCIFAFIPQ